jgi:HEAT repeats
VAATGGRVRPVVADNSGRGPALTDNSGRGPALTDDSITAQMQTEYTRLRDQNGGHAAFLIIDGVPDNNDPARGPTARNVEDAIDRRLRELAPECLSLVGRSAHGRKWVVMAPVNDRAALVAGINFGSVRLSRDRIEVRVDPQYIAAAGPVPAQPGAVPPGGIPVGPPGGFPMGPRGGFPVGPPAMPGPFPPGGPPPVMMSMDVVENMERDYQALRQEYGDRTAAILVTGLPAGGDPHVNDITEAISKRIKQLAPEIAQSRAVRINERFATVVAPVNDIQALAIGIDFGTVTVKNSRIEVQLDARWAANVPRKAPEPRPGTPAARPGRDEPDVPLGADVVTRSLIELKTSDPWKRKRALERLQRTAPDGRVVQVVDAVAPILEDDDGFVAQEAAKTLGVWRSPEAMEALIGRMRDNRHFVRSDAIKALGHYRELRAAEAIVTVMKEDRFATEEALKAMGEVAEPALLPVLRNPNPGLRSHACQILAQIGGQKTLQEMQSLPADPDFGVRVAAQDAWKQIVARFGPPPKPARGKAGTGSAPAGRR